MNPLQSLNDSWTNESDYSQVRASIERPSFDMDEVYDSLTQGMIKRVMRDVAQLPSNKILIGYTERECEGSPVTIPIYTYTRDRPQSTKILISAAQAGSGKTQLALNILEMYTYHLGYNVVIFDAKPEAHSRKVAQDDPRLKELLYKVNQQFSDVKPRGWTSMLSVKPMFSDRNDPFTGVEVRYDLDHLNFQDIVTLFGLNPRSKEDYTMIDKLDMLVHGRMEMENIGEERVEEERILTCREVGALISSGEYKVDKFLVRRFKNLFDNKVIGRNTDFDIVDHLNQGRTVQYQTRLVENKNPIPETLAYVSCEVRNIYRGRYAVRNNTGDERVKKIRRPVVVYANEMQTIYPRNPAWPSSKIELDNYLNTGRTYGLDLVGDSTSLIGMHENFIKNSDYLMTFRLDGTNGEHLRKVKNIDWAQMDQIYQLEEDKDNPPFQCAIIRPGMLPTEPLQTFYPCPPMGSMKANTN